MRITRLTPEDNGEELSPEDFYPDSDDTLTIFRGGKKLQTLRAMVRYGAGAGYFVLLREGGLLAVAKEVGDHNFVAQLPEGRANDT